jgi:hypothetical protein
MKRKRCPKHGISEIANIYQASSDDEYVPTADQRALVENAAAFGITQADIAEQLKIDECVRLQRPEQRIGLGIA